jgi:hypothetical protein
VTYKIEKGIPLPPPANGRPQSKPNSYPWDDMEVGDSFFVHDPQKVNSVKVSAHNMNSRSKRKFTTRILDGGIRVWRIE